MSICSLCDCFFFFFLVIEGDVLIHSFILSSQSSPSVLNYSLTHTKLPPIPLTIIIGYGPSSKKKKKQSIIGRNFLRVLIYLFPTPSVSLSINNSSYFTISTVTMVIFNSEISCFYFIFFLLFRNHFPFLSLYSDVWCLNLSVQTAV